MGSITINGKNVKEWVIGGKTVQSLTMGSKILSFIKREPNSFTGTWSSPEQEAAFMAITDTVAENKFFFETGITSITLPETTTIETNAFVYSSSLSSVHIPKAITIGDKSFDGTSNNLEIWINKKFNTNAEKDRIFGTGKWNNITFHWLNNDGTEYVQHTNKFGGSFTDSQKQAEFMAITDTVADSQFSTEIGLTMISFSNVKNIGVNAFYYAPITVVDLPECTSIGAGAFHYSPANLGLDIPKCETIGDGAFVGISNASTTQVRMKSKFNTFAEKTRIFGDSNWTNLKFYWV